MHADDFLVPVAPDHPVLEDAPGTCTFAFHFTGTGREYFRIWIINLLLSVATLGVYSAWAKVRRLQYFDRNTLLAGAGFDFHGAPKAILRGRILAVALLAAYQYAFGFSLLFGLVVVAILLVSLPWMMRGALRFRMGNTSWRGLRFHFAGSVPLAYRAYLAPIAVFLLPGVAVALLGRTAWSILPFALYLLWPAMYGRMKRYQFGHVVYGGLHSSTDLPLRRFFGIYVRGLLLGLAPIVVLIILAVAAKPLAGVPKAAATGFLVIGVGVVGTLMAYVMLGPYLQVRTLDLCLPRTRFPGVRFVSTLSARRFARLQVKNLLLTLITLGLYRPFAVVSAHQYRLAHITLEVDADFDQVLAHLAPADGAAGDATADFLGVDLSW